MTFIKVKSWRRVLATVMAGVVLIAVGFHLLLWPDSQVSLYNQGIQAYRTGQAQEAIQLFDRSLSVYDKRSNDSWLERFVYPSPDRGLASKASFHKAKALIRMKKGQEAVDAFKVSLQLNPGNGYEFLDGYEHFGAEEIAELHEHAKVVKYDLELLFKNNKQLGEGEGKGKGQPKPGDQEGKKQQPGQQPGDQPGKGDPKEI